nr:MAG TPA: hypothetical protein [Caudoviricetes sp.]
MNVEKIIKKYEHLYGHHVIIVDYKEITPSHYKVKLREHFLQYFVDIIHRNGKVDIVNSIGGSLLDIYPNNQVEKFQKGAIKYV